MALTIPMAQLLGVFLESVAYGVYMMVFNQCMSVLRKRPGYSRQTNHLVGTAVSLFILTTTHLFIDILRNIQAFALNTAEPNYPTIYYSIYNTWTDILKSVLYVAVTLVSDAFILYRLFIVWDRSYSITILPFLLFTADIAISVLWVYTLTLVMPDDDVYASVLSVRVKVFYSITLAMNVICTSLIAFRILRLQKRAAPFTTISKDQFSRAVEIIVESCSIYSALLVVMITTFASGSPAVFTVLNFMCPIIGIVFSSVIVRVGLGVSHGDSHYTERTISSVRGPFRRSFRSDSNEHNHPETIPHGGVQVSLQQKIHTHINGFPDSHDVTNDAPVMHAKLDSSSFHAI